MKLVWGQSHRRLMNGGINRINLSRGLVSQGVLSCVPYFAARVNLSRARRQFAVLSFGSLKRALRTSGLLALLFAQILPPAAAVASKLGTLLLPGRFRRGAGRPAF